MWGKFQSEWGGTDGVGVSSEIEHIWQMIYRFGFYRGGPVLMSALAGVSFLPKRVFGMEVRRVRADSWRLISHCGI